MGPDRWDWTPLYWGPIGGIYYPLTGVTYVGRNSRHPIAQRNAAGLLLTSYEFQPSQLRPESENLAFDTGVC